MKTLRVGRATGNGLQPRRQPFRLPEDLHGNGDAVRMAQKSSNASTAQGQRPPSSAVTTDHMVAQEEAGPLARFARLPATHAAAGIARVAQR